MKKQRIFVEQSGKIQTTHENKWRKNTKNVIFITSAMQILWTYKEFIKESRNA